MVLVGSAGSYEVDRSSLRAGGQAEVFRARSKGGRSVAIKIAREPGAAGAWLNEERALLRRLGEGQDRSVPWIVPVEDHGVSADGRPFVVLPWYDWSLHGWIKARHPPVELRLLALEQAISAVIRLHRSPADFVEVALHRDLKPHNFLVREENGRVCVVLADLGTAKQGRLLHATANTGIFTRFYAPIEQQLPLVGSVDASVDVHALAATLYECLCERLPQSLMMREAAFTPLAHELVVLYQHEGARSPKEEARFQELARMPVERFFRPGEADALTEEDRARLAECVPDPVCAVLLPVLEQALAALPGARLGRPEVLLAATRQARMAVGVEAASVVEVAPKEEPKRRGVGCWLAVAVAAALGLGMLGAAGWWASRGRVVEAPVVEVPKKVSPAPAPAPTPEPAPASAPVPRVSILTRAPAPAPTAEAATTKGVGGAVAQSPQTPAPTPSFCPAETSVFLLHSDTPSPVIRVDGVVIASTAGPVAVRSGAAQSVEIAGPGTSTCRFSWQLRDQPDGTCALSVASLPLKPVLLSSEARLACAVDGTVNWQ